MYCVVLEDDWDDLQTFDSLEEANDHITDAIGEMEQDCLAEELLAAVDDIDPRIYEMKEMAKPHAVLAFKQALQEKELLEIKERAEKLGYQLTPKENK